MAIAGRSFVRNSCRGNHLGQRSCASATTGRTYERKRSDQITSKSCKEGAVHIWRTARRSPEQHRDSLGSGLKLCPDLVGWRRSGSGCDKWQADVRPMARCGRLQTSGLHAGPIENCCSSTPMRQFRSAVLAMLWRPEGLQNAPPIRSSLRHRRSPAFGQPLRTVDGS